MKIIIIALLCAVNITTANAMTLNESLIGAYNYNPELLAKREELKAIDEYMYQAIAEFLPNIYLHSRNSQYSPSRKGIRTTNGASNGDSNDYDYGKISPKRNKITTQENSFIIDYNLFQGGISAITIRKAKAYIMKARADLALVEARILFATVSAYNDVILKNQLLLIYQKNLENMQKTLEITKDRFSAGLLKKTEISISEREVALAESLLDKAEGDLITANAKLKQNIGFEPLNLESALPIIDLPNKMDDLVFSAVRNNPYIAMAHYIIEAADCDVRASIAGFWPNVNLQNKISNTTNKYNNYNSPRMKSKTITFSLVMPLYNKGVEYSRVRQARAVLSATLLKSSSIVEEVKQKSIQAWSMYIASDASCRASEKAVKAANIALDSSIHEYQEGVASIAELLNSQRQLLSAQYHMYHAIAEKVNGSYNILAMLGRLNAKDLELHTKYYDPTENYDANKLRFIGF